MMNISFVTILKQWQNTHTYHGYKLQRPTCSPTLLAPEQVIYYFPTHTPCRSLSHFPYTCCKSSSKDHHNYIIIIPSLDHSRFLLAKALSVRIDVDPITDLRINDLIAVAGESIIINLPTLQRHLSAGESIKESDWGWASEPRKHVQILGQPLLDTEHNPRRLGRINII